MVQTKSTDSEYKGHNNIYPIDLEDMQQHVGTPQRLVKVYSVAI